MNNYTSVFKNRNVLITGGCGFIGSNLARKLIDYSANVKVVDSLIPDYGGNLYNLVGYEDRIKLNISDVRDQYSMEYLVKDQDYLFNLAGQISHIDSMNNPFLDQEINVRSQLSILEACRTQNTKVRIVFASTRQIYGKPTYLPVDEKHPLQPVDVNGINKIAGEFYHMLYGKVYRIPVTSIRLTNVYGPRMRIKDARQTFIGWWIRQAIERKPIQIFGDGLQLRDLNYIDDVVDALIGTAVADSTIGEIYNLGAKPISLLDLAKLFSQIENDVCYELVPFPSERKSIDIGSFYGDYSKIKSAIGWEPQINYCDGLRKTLDYYSKNLIRYL